MPDEMIKTLLQPQGDWYLVSVDRDLDKGESWYIDRVVLWALRSGDKMIDHIVTVGTTGLPDCEDQSRDRYFVFGKDSCPDGRSWDEVFQNTKPTTEMVREFTDVGRKWSAEEINHAK